MGYAVAICPNVEDKMTKDNVVLIGMPSSGKSTIGPLLAEKLKMDFLDTDTLIVQRVGKALRDIVNEDGLEHFLQIQDNVVCGIDVKGMVVATGGGIVYGNRAMAHLAGAGIIVYLKLSLEEIQKRISPGRRLASNKGQSIEDLYNERVPLYEKYSNFTLECSNKGVREIVDEIISRVK